LIMCVLCYLNFEMTGLTFEYRLPKRQDMIKKL